MSHYEDLVCDATEIWDQFPMMSKEGLIGLVKSREQQMAIAIDIFIGQVLNGGFDQWTANGYAQPMYRCVIDAFQKIDTAHSNAAIDLIHRAGRITDYFDDCGEATESALDKLDTKFYAFSDELTKEVTAWFEQFAPQLVESGYSI